MAAKRKAADCALEAEVDELAARHHRARQSLYAHRVELKRLDVETAALAARRQPLQDALDAADRQLSETKRQLDEKRPVLEAQQLAVLDHEYAQLDRADRSLENLQALLSLWQRRLRAKGQNAFLTPCPSGAKWWQLWSGGIVTGVMARVKTDGGVYTKTGHKALCNVFTDAPACWRLP